MKNVFAFARARRARHVQPGSGSCQAGRSRIQQVLRDRVLPRSPRRQRRRAPTGCAWSRRSFHQQNGYRWRSQYCDAGIRIDTLARRSELVVAYVTSLNGVTTLVNSGPSGIPIAKLSGDAARGRDLFSDAVRSFGMLLPACHEVGGIGIPIATPIAKVPTDVAALKALATPQVSTAMIGSESMPALVVSKKA